MSRALILTVAGAVLGPLFCYGDVPAPNTMPEANLLVGQWHVEFANGVTEVCAIAKVGTASVIEARRAAGGKTAVRGGSVVIVYDDDRVERWTPVGKKAVVEHWYPGSALPTATPVLGIAERLQ
jgi:hypothetical protein